MAISANLWRTIGLKADGTLVATRYVTNYSGDILKWTDIVAVSTSSSHIIGLKSDGTLVATGSNDYNECDVSDWTDIYVPKTPSQHTAIGDIVTFGRYRRDKLSPAENIDWIVLDKKDDSLLLLSKYILDFKPYHNVEGYVEWTDCSLRTWLNKDFYNAAFSSSERANILEAGLSPSTHCVQPEVTSTTLDNVFILSTEEIEFYFDVPAQNSGADSDYAKLATYMTPCYDFSQNYVQEWWVRSKSISGSIYFCPKNGRIGSSMKTVDQELGVRPAIWVKVS